MAFNWWNDWGKCTSIVLLILGVVVMLLIGTPLYTAGYEDRVAANELLRETSCVVTDSGFTSATCHRDCNCRTVYYTSTCPDSDGEGTHSCRKSRRECDRCPYDCYAVWHEFSYLAKGQNYTKKITGGKRDTKTQVNSYLASYPNGKKWTCYYNSEKPEEVIDSMYKAEEFKIAALVFLALGGLCFYIGCCMGSFGLVSDMNIDVGNAIFKFLFEDEKPKDESDRDYEMPTRSAYNEESSEITESADFQPIKTGSSDFD